MLLARPTGRFPVGVQDLAYSTNPSSIAADTHVVGRLFYPCKAPSRLATPLTWIRHYKYAQGYVSWGLRNPSGLKEKLLKQTAQNLIYALGSVRLLPCSYNAAAEDRQGKFPVIIFSHGAASMRNTYSIICSEFASRGFVVAAVEHADGTACCAQLADGEWRLLQGLGTGAALEAKCDYRVQECVTMARALQAMNAGASVPGLTLSSAADPAAAFQSRLDMSRLAVMGHSCGGATAAAAAAAHAEFKCGVALDPWWPLLPSGGAALSGWRTRSPLLVLGSQDWNTGKMWCGGDRQAAVFKACLPAPSSASSSSSQPSARTPVVAAAAAAHGSSGAGSEAGPGGGAVHVVPAGSSHGSFTDLPFLLSPWVSNLLRKTVGAKVQEQPANPDTIQDTIIWSSHTFLQAHLPLPEESPASMQQQQRWEARLQDKQQQQQKLEAGDGSSSSSAEASGAGAAGGEAAPASEAVVKAAGTAFARAAAAVAAPAGPAAGDEHGNGNGNGSGTGRVMLSTSGRRDSLVDHLTADETLIAADEAAGAVPPVARSEQHDSALERASSAELSAAAGRVPLPVEQQEEQQYKTRLGDAAYLVAVHTR
ncbi:platelet-activating factor acetylhydrolase, isoform II-domain-containing protein [Scenedesmus sp. NREL 46B-D3]|nr:platelet-activating factor acetylhydrolase, isoform II-domain-containing protein [Scenedesmus sp. NREL 46B-D3]